MAIFLESRDVAFSGNPFQHMYLVRVPDDNLDDYASYQTIGAFPQNPSTLGPWGLLQATYTGQPLASANAPNGNDQYPVEGQSGAVRAWAVENRNSRLIFEETTEGTTEEDVWSALIAQAELHGDEFTYKASQQPGSGIWGPTVNSNSFIISTLLNTEAALGISFEQIQLPELAPGQFTWLGTGAADTLSLANPRAQAASIVDLYGGDGADNLSAAGSNAGSTIVAGDDTDRDTVLGGSGEDIIVGYFNQSALDESDILGGGDGDDNFLIIDPELALPGGIPDLDVEFGTGGLDFTHDGQTLGSGGLIDGGDGVDTLSYQFITGPVSLLLDDVTVRNIEHISLTSFADHVFLQSTSFVQINGGVGIDTLEGPSDGTIQIDQTFHGSGTYTVRDPSNENEEEFALADSFEVFQTGTQDDALNFQLLDEAGEEVIGSGIQIAAFSGGGEDTVTGTGSHDELHGGEGNDVIAGGHGADYLYDNGSTRPYQEGQDFETYINQILAYDTNGDDTITGGAGSDVFLHSGGTDVFEGGAGHDTYLTVGEVHGSYNNQDNLTIILSEDPNDEETFFGHDLIVGDGRGIDLVQFEGINSSDVTISYEFEEIFIDSHVVEFNSQFWWQFEFEPQTVDYYQTVGSVEIRVNSTGSSLTVEEVVGYHVRGDNPSGLVQIEAQMGVPFSVLFDDGYMAWVDVLLDPSNNYYTFANNELSDTAFDARGALEAERAVPETDIYGDEEEDVPYNDDPYDDDRYLLGTNGSDRITGTINADYILAGGGDDQIIGRAGADTIDGGTGTDTASYENASAAVGIRLRDSGFQSGDAVGDVYTNVENLRGSAFDDYLGGDDQRNFIYGGDGNDRIFGFGGIDELHGEDGDDELATSYWHDDRLYGGSGSDTLRGSSGDDFLYGGTGDDLLISNFQPNIYGDLTPGNDYFDGGDGTDTAEFWYIGGDLVVDLEAGKAYLGATGEIVSLVSIENAMTNRSDDVLIGSDGDNVLHGGDGDDLLVGGGGNDTLFGNDGDDRIFGGTGIDTARLFGATQAMASYALIEGGVVVTIASSHPDATWETDGGTFTIYDDVEFIEFDDGVRTYQEIATPLRTEFAVIDDFLRVDEAAPATLDFTANDIEYQSDPISLVTLNGEVATAGSVQRLDSGATLTVESDGTVTFDQGGAYAWLDAGETVTETFTYTATDSNGVEQESTATVIVDGADSSSRMIHLLNNVFVTEINPDAADALRIANFDVGRSILIVDEQYIDPNDVPAGITLQEINGDTFVTFGGNDAVVLSDISLATWQHAASLQAAGGAGDDILAGSDGQDIINLGAGNDSFTALAGDDVVVGGAGDDTIIFTGGDNIVLGGNGSDSINAGGNGDNLFYGGAGNDRLNGRDGSDTLNGGSGNDVIFGGDNNDTLIGGAGDDEFYGGDGIDFFDGGDGFDRLELQSEYPASFPPGLIVNMVAGYFAWADSSYGLERFENIEMVVGASGDDLLLGDDQDNWLDGVGGNDTAYGGAGNDTLTDGGGDNILYGEDGDDILVVSGSGTNELYGGNGDDLLRAYRGFNTIDGGDGVDTLDLSGATTSWDTDIDLTVGSFGSGSNITTFVSIENVIGTPGDNIITGNAGANRLNGGDNLISGDDLISGGAGDDTLIGGTGNDTLIGGEDADTAVFDINFADATISNAGAQLSVSSAAQGEDLIENDVEFITFNDVTYSFSDLYDAPENTSPVTEADVLTVSEDASAEINVLANDTDADGDPLSVTMVGGQAISVGNPVTLISGAIVALLPNGALSYDPNGAFESLNAGETAAETITYTISDGQGGIADGDITVTITGVSAGSDGVVTGTAGGDIIDGSFVDVDGDVINNRGQTILAGAGDDRIYDGAGDDTVDGGAGRDLFYAGAGADQYDGGADRDEVLYTTATAGLTIDMTDATNSTGIAAGDTFANIEFLHGSEFDDVIVANGQRIFGRNGDDIIQDATGNQRLIGGSGSDTFRFIAGDGTQDRIADFTLDEDMIDLSLWGATQLSDLNIYEAVNGQGVLQGRLTIEYNGESIRVDGLTNADIASLDESHFVFDGSVMPPDPGDFAGATIDGTAGNDRVDGAFVDADGESISGGGQTILAGSGDDRIYDGAGDDIVNGGAGRDLFYAGDGADVYDGGSDRDEVFYTTAITGLTIDMTDATNSTGIAAGDTFSNIEYIHGSEFEDVIVADNQRVFGRGGGDIIQDAAGNQRLIGGSGSDTFRFVAGDGTQDRIADFTLDEDMIDLSLWGATQLSDLNIYEAVNGQGNLQGRLNIDYNGESIRLDGLTTADITSLDQDHFVFM